jgi:hypothetical protein
MCSNLTKAEFKTQKKLILFSNTVLKIGFEMKEYI